MRSKKLSTDPPLSSVIILSDDGDVKKNTVGFAFYWRRACKLQEGFDSLRNKNDIGGFIFYMTNF